MSSYWLIASKDRRDVSTKDWGNEWTVNGFLKNKKYYPWKNRNVLSPGDICLLRVFGEKKIIARFKIKSEAKKDNNGNAYHEIEDIVEFEFPLDIPSLPKKHMKYFDRNLVKPLMDEDYHEIMGIIYFLQNLRLNYKNILHVNLSERHLENLLDSVIKPLETIGYDIIERQPQAQDGTRMDLLCKDGKGDLVVIELKKRPANQTIGQLARYITDVRENYASSTQKVRGMILALDIDEQLVKAARGVDFEVVLYQIGYY